MMLQKACKKSRLAVPILLVVKAGPSPLLTASKTCHCEKADWWPPDAVGTTLPGRTNRHRFGGLSMYFFPPVLPSFRPSAASANCTPTQLPDAWCKGPWY
ncbi:hypothetical protein DIPPA_00526 [Diplonema papillatum]|nr:hypothetical protein DIPPA_00526 [Diplonema papillatum]